MMFTWPSVASWMPPVSIERHGERGRDQHQEKERDEREEKQLLVGAKHAEAGLGELDAAPKSFEH